MKNITEILAGAGVSVPADKTEAFNKELHANYKTIAEFDKQKEAHDALKTQLAEFQTKLKEFEGVDVAALKSEITKLSGDLTAAQKKHAAELADRDFSDAVEKAITGAKGKNPKAITALLNLDGLKASKNQKADIAAALEGLKTSDAYLFDVEKQTDGKTPAKVSTGGTHSSTGGGGSDTNATMNALIKGETRGE